VLAAAANGVVELIDRYHGDVDSIFGRATIDTDQLDSPFNELNLRQYCMLFEEAAAQTGHDNFGLQFGHDFLPKRLGAIGYIAINSPNVSAGLRNLIRYFPAHQGSSILSLEQDQDLLWLCYQIIDPRIEGRRQDAELSLGMFTNIFRHALGPGWRPVEVHFEHHRPDCAAEHQAKFDAPVLFDQKVNALAFRREELDAEMPANDPYLFAVIEPFLAERRELRQNPEDFVTALRHEIKLRLGDSPPSLERLAASLGLTSTGLRRRLKAFGVGFNDLVRAARQELALRYVADHDMPLTEVALALGYSELSAFSRAFRAWTGMSPQRFRRRRHHP
jgi:AraC-like DNA-binding protein